MNSSSRLVLIIIGLLVLGGLGFVWGYVLNYNSPLPTANSTFTKTPFVLSTQEPEVIYQEKPIYIPQPQQKDWREGNKEIEEANRKRLQEIDDNLREAQQQQEERQQRIQDNLDTQRFLDCYNLGVCY